ncbi:MAG TPA: ABC transporter permease [Polyangia bacterium]|nr:ABC transporter permease [Polyangia bacterium]
MGTFLADLKYGARLLIRTPVVSLIAILTLALGIGANTAIFTVVHSVVMRPLPYPNADRLVELYTQFPTMKFDKFWFSSPEFLDLQHDARSYKSIGAYQLGGAPVIGGETPVRAVTAYCSPSLLPTIGVEPLLGRFFTADEDIRDHPQGVVLSWGLWQRLFGGDPGIIGRAIRVDSDMTHVVGVMPRGFAFPGEGTELWVPGGMSNEERRRASHNWSVIGRLADGVTPGQATAELTSLQTAWAGKHKHVIDEKHPMTLRPLMGEIVGTLRSPLLILQGAVFLVLLIACANISGLLLARAEARSREIAIRMALGAGRARLARQLLTESLLVGVLGGALGLLMAAWGLDLMLAMVPSNAPRMAEVHMDGAVLAFTAAAAFVTSVVFGLAPVFHVGGPGFQLALSGAGTRATGGLGRQRFRRALVIAEMALAVVLVVGSGLMIKSFARVLDVDTGIRPHGLLTFQIELPAKEYPDNDRALALWNQLRERMAALPGVTDATVLAGLPPNRQLNANDFFFEGKTQTKDGPAWNVDFFQTVGDDFWKTMGTTLVEGRVLDEHDNADGMLAVVVNEQFVRRFYPGEKVLGRRVRPEMDDPWWTIVGVVKDVKQQGLEAPTGTEVYFATRQIAKAYPRSLNIMHVALRTDVGSPRSLEKAVRNAVGEIDSQLAVAKLATMDELMYDAVAKPRFLSTLLGALAGLALVLAAIGIYGVMSYSVAQRTRELGIRMALGAEPARVRAMVLGQGLRLGVLGIVGGTLIALGVNLVLRHALADMLFKVSAVDPLTFAGALVGMLCVATLACWAPARRATRVDPMVALRED